MCGAKGAERNHLSHILCETHNEVSTGSDSDRVSTSLTQLNMSSQVTVCSPLKIDRRCDWRLIGGFPAPDPRLGLPAAVCIPRCDRKCHRESPAISRSGNTPPSSVSR